MVNLLPGGTVAFFCRHGAMTPRKTEGWNYPAAFLRFDDCIYSYAKLYYGVRCMHERKIKYKRTI